MRSRVLIAVLATVALVPAAMAATPAPALAAGFVAALRAPTHHPRADRNWVITVTARTRSGRALRATAFYEFLFNGQVVSTQYPDPHGPPHQSPWTFTGSFSDAVVWPRRSVGVPLTFRVVVRARGLGTVNLDYRVRVRR
jgi:hypothetical protein